MVPGFGTNLLSAPRMEKAGWYLSRGKGQFVAKDGQGQTVFSVNADFKGLYYLRNVAISQVVLALSTAPADIRDQRNFSHGLAERQKRHIFSQKVSMTKPVRFSRCLLQMCVGRDLRKERGMIRTLICI